MTELYKEILNPIEVEEKNERGEAEICGGSEKCEAPVGYVIADETYAKLKHYGYEGTERICDGHANLLESLAGHLAR